MINYNENQSAVIWLDSFSGLEYKIKREILDNCGEPAQILQNMPKFRTFITKTAGEGVYNNMYTAATREYVAGVLSELKHRGITAITYLSPLYPEALAATPAYPIVLYCKGDTALLKEEKFGIVGSRRTAANVMRAAEDTAEALSEHFAIVTGLAEGGDTAAVKGALKNSRIICVLAYGFKFVYPDYNSRLLDEVVKNGLAVTEHTYDTPPQPYLFPVRNRIIAGLCKGVLIVSGGAKSGTYHTGNYANEYSRDIFAFPYGIGSTVGSACNYFIKNFGCLAENADDILKHYGLDIQKPVRAAAILTESEQSVLNALSENTHINEIIARTGMRIHELLPVLSSLEIKGAAFKSASNTYTAKNN